VILNALFNLQWRRFQRACAHPLRAQAAQLRRVLAGAARTDIGSQCDFASIARLADPAAMMAAYQARVPVRTYKEMQAGLEAVYAGRWEALCPSAPLWFAMTAGSTGRYKYIPVTPEYRRDVGRASMVFQGALEACFPEVRSLKTQFLAGSAEGGLAPGGVPQGFASGFNYKHLPGLVRRRFVLPYWVFTLDDPMERAYAAGRILMHDPRLGVLCAISPVNLINLRQALDQLADRLIADVAAGTLTVHGTAAVAGTWAAPSDPGRARILQDARGRTGSLPTRALFPALRVLVCWQGGNMGYYLPPLRRAFEVEQCMEFPISASEGVFAVPFRANQPGGALAVSTHFLEFADSAGVHRAHELVAGREYRVIVTNSAGLYRYDMEDLVRVTSFFRATPVIEFVAKADRQVSVSNERITELDVTRAMQATTARCGRWFSEFLFVPCSDRRYRVLVDGAAWRDDDQPAFAAELDHQLRLAAKGYDFEREDALLEPLELVVTAPGELREYLARRQHHALPNAQVKPQHLSSEFDAHLRFATMVTHAS
jgi:hypothetical protein